MPDAFGAGRMDTDIGYTETDAAVPDDTNSEKGDPKPTTQNAEHQENESCDEESSDSDTSDDSDDDDDRIFGQPEEAKEDTAMFRKRLWRKWRNSTRNAEARLDTSAGHRLRTGNQNTKQGPSQPGSIQTYACATRYFILCWRQTLVSLRDDILTSTGR